MRDLVDHPGGKPGIIDLPKAHKAAHGPGPLVPDRQQVRLTGPHYNRPPLAAWISLRLE
jgi:hypothetical protein